MNDTKTVVTFFCDGNPSTLMIFRLEQTSPLSRNEALTNPHPLRDNSNIEFLLSPIDQNEISTVWQGCDEGDLLSPSQSLVFAFDTMDSSVGNSIIQRIYCGWTNVPTYEMYEEY